MSNLVIDDPLYGKFGVDEPVLLDLLETEAMRRLKRISQPFLPPKLLLRSDLHYSRYEHSVGCLLLLKALGAGLEEQIAGLLHDISHTAFSHLVDHVIGDPTREGFQDARHKKFLLSSDASPALRRYGFSPARLADLRNYGLLERPIPELSVDRIDYSLRDYYRWKKRNAGGMAKELVVSQGRLAFRSRESASAFGRMYMSVVCGYHNGKRYVVRRQIFAEALKLAVAKKIVKLEDFERDDEFVFRKMEAAKDESINRLLTAMIGNSYHFKKGTEMQASSKFRYLDPSFVENGEMASLTQVDAEYLELVDRCRGTVTKGYSFDLRL